MFLVLNLKYNTCIPSHVTKNDILHELRMLNVCAIKLNAKVTVTTTDELILLTSDL